MVWLAPLFIASLVILLLAGQSPIGFVCVLVAWISMAWSEAILILKVQRTTDRDALTEYARQSQVRRVMLNVMALTTYGYLVVRRRFENPSIRREMVVELGMVVLYYGAGLYWAIRTVGDLNGKALSFLIFLFVLRPANLGLAFLARFLFGRWL